uniref:Glutathione S-transferase n=1 Tax=Eocanthecona furcellata TaxID=696902 RepID=A0AA49X760_9HEMI|nr:glutathione S-transferase [Eocanthecona furcellata]
MASSSEPSDIITLYIDPLSQASRAIQLFLGINGIDFDTKEIAFAEGSKEAEEFAKINPFKKVPVIAHKGNFVREGIAILRYLCSEFQVEDHWYPEDSLKRARVDEYLEWHHLETRAKSVIYIFSSSYQPVEESRLEQCRSKLDRSCDLIDKVWLQEGKYIAGEEISIADIVAATELEQLAMTDYDPRRGRPRLDAWMLRVRQDTNPLYDVVHNYLKEFCAARLKSLSASSCCWR